MPFRIAVRIPLTDAARAALTAFAEPAGDLASADGLLVNSTVPVDEAVLAAAPRLRVVATASVGYDNVDLPGLGARGIALANSRGSLTEAVADLTFALIVMALRRLPQAIAWTRAGRWSAGETFPFAHDVAAKTLGIVGMGEIGLAVAARARVAGMRVRYANRRPRADDAVTGAAFRPFDALLAESDVVLALVPLVPETEALFDRATFAKMKPGAFFVNAARGRVADTAALLEALESGRLGGAALDVTDPEPLPPGHPLLARDDVIVTPHVGSATHETRERMSLVAIENLRAFAAGEPMPNAIPLQEPAGRRPMTS